MLWIALEGLGLRGEITLFIAITDCDHPSVDIEMDILTKQGIEVGYFNCKTEEDVIRHCQDADGIIVQYAPFTRDVMKALPKCKVISNYGVGTDNVDLEAATELGIQVCNVPDYGIEEVSDHALTLIFNLAKKVNVLSEQTKNNGWDFRVARPIRRMSKQTIGVIGLGDIGLTLANKLHALGLHVIGYARQSIPGLPFEQVSFEQLIRESDIISIHLPLNEGTRDLIDKDVLAQMKSDVIIVNTARGGIINEADLLEALRNDQVGGVGLDVLSQEPPEQDFPILAFENVIVTPHSAWYSEEALEELKRKAAEEAMNFLLDKEIRYPVNRLANDKNN